MTQQTCSVCSEPAIIERGDYDFSDLADVGGIVLTNIELIRCTQCGNVDPVIPRMADIMRLIGVAIVMQPRSLRGDELRYLRKYLGLSAERFAAIVGVNKSVMSRWENGHDDIGPQSDRLIRLLFMALGKRTRQLSRDAAKSFDNLGSGRRMGTIVIDARDLTYDFAESHQHSRGENEESPHEPAL